MKTIDEVITEMEECGFVGTLADALHYLKAYKEDRNELTALRAYWKEMHEDVRQKAEENDEDVR